MVIGASMFLFTAFVLIFNKTMENRLNSLYSDKLASLYGATVKNQGVAIQERGIDANHFMIFGSSELSSQVPQNPLSFFPTKEAPYYMDAVGRGYSQSLEHMLNIGALGGKLKNKKIAIIVSIQWFFDKKGITPDNFIMNFSELQFYKFMDSKDIPKEQKGFVAKRVYENLKGNDKYKLSMLNAKLYLGENALTKVEYYAFKPYYFFRKNLLYSKDLVQSIKYIKEKKLYAKGKPQLKSINWQEEIVKAETSGKKASTNNIYNIEDSYYTKYLEPNISKLKDYYKDVRPKDSKEFKDFKELLKTAKNLGAKPYIIITPVNGTLYDYEGITKEERKGYYDAVEELSQKNNVPYLNMSDKDYEPYFIADAMHLGWRGWLYVDQKISEYNSTN